MADDDCDLVQTMDIRVPPLTGPGSSRAAWIAYATEIVEANQNLVALIRDQQRTIRYQLSKLNWHAAETERLQTKGIRQRLPASKVARIKELVAEGRSTREIAKACGVSPMTASRLGRAMKRGDTGA